MSSSQAQTEEDKIIEQWKIKKLIKNLEAARGAGTSVISLIMTPREQISAMNKKLTEEYGTASNIKSRVNRLSVQEAITSTQQRLKLYNKVPENGLVLYCGNVMTDEGKEKKVTIDFEPFKPINTSLYLCDNKFHTEPLSSMMESDEKFGFIIMDGNGSLFGTLAGNTRSVLHKMTVDLPKKHGRGGQSALRFARLREEKRHNYVRKVGELAVQFFITNDKPNISYLIMAGSADFKSELSKSDLLDQRLQAIVIKIVDVAYGGESGFNQAIELSQDCLSNVRFIREKKVIDQFFEEIAQDSGKYVFGVEETIKAMEMGATKTLICWENLEYNRYIFKHPSTGEEQVFVLSAEQEKDPKYFTDPDSGVKLEFEVESLLDWLANNYKKFGTALEIVTNKSQEGNQFVKGFGGIGGLLRYKVNFDEMNAYLEHEGIDDDLDDFI